MRAACRLSKSHIASDTLRAACTILLEFPQQVAYMPCGIFHNLSAFYSTLIRVFEEMRSQHVITTLLLRAARYTA